MTDIDNSSALLERLRAAATEPSKLLEEIRTQALHTSNVIDAPAFSFAATLNDEGFPLVDVVAQGIREGLPKWDVYTFLMPAVERCTRVSCASIVALLSAFSETFESLPDNIVSTLVPIFTANSRLGYECLDACFDGAKTSSAVTRAVAIATGVTYQCGSISYFLELARSDALHRAEAGVRGLAAVDVECLASEPEWISAIQEVAQKSQSTPALRHVGYQLQCQLAWVDPASGERLLSDIRADIPEAQMEAAHWLRFLARTAPTEQTGVMLLELTRAAMRNPDLCNAVDFTVNLFVHGNHSEGVVDNLLDVIGRDFRGRFEAQFPCLFGALSSDSAMFATVASRWLLADDVSTDALGALLSLAPSAPHRIRADTAAFANAPQAARRRAIRRLIGLCYNGAAIAGFLVQLACDPSNEPWARPAFADVANNFLHIEYPSETCRFLESAVKDLGIGRLKKDVQAVLKNMREWEKVLRELPTLRELEPRREKLIAVDLARRRRDAEISHAARAKSIFAQTVSRVHIKQGRHTLSRMPDGSTHVTELRSHVVQFEVPSSEASDPLSGVLTRLQYLSDGT